MAKLSYGSSLFIIFLILKDLVMPQFDSDSARKKVANMWKQVFLFLPALPTQTAVLHFNHLFFF